MELEQPQKAMEFVRLDAGSEWAARAAAHIFLREGKLAEARQSLRRISTTPVMGDDLLQACLDPSQPPSLERIAQKAEATALAGTDAVRNQAQDGTPTRTENGCCSGRLNSVYFLAA
jgi:hypothetical protein